MDATSSDSEESEAAPLTALGREAAFLDKVHNRESVCSVGDVVDYLRLSLKDEEIQHKGMRALVTFGNASSNYESLTSTGAADSVISAMRHHPENAHLLRASCAALKRLTSDLCCASALVRKGAGVEVTKSITQFPKNHRLAVAACGALAALAKQDNSYTLVNEGSAAAVVEAMRRHPKELKLQEAGCYAIAALSLQESKRKVWDTGAAHVVLTAMRRFTSKDKVTLAGLKALRSLGFPYSLMHLGGLEVIVDAAGNHSEKPNIVSSAFEILKSFANVEMVASYLIDLNAFEILTQLQRTDTQPPSVLCCEAVCNLSQWKSQQEDLITRGCANFCKKLMKDFKNTKSLARIGLKICFHLADHQSENVVLLELGMDKTVTRKLKSLLKHKKKKRKGDDILVALKTLDRMHFHDYSKLKKLDLSEVLIDVQKSFTDNRDLKEMTGELIDIVNL